MHRPSDASHDSPGQDGGNGVRFRRLGRAWREQVSASHEASDVSSPDVPARDALAPGASGGEEGDSGGEARGGAETRPGRAAEDGLTNDHRDDHHTASEESEMSHEATTETERKERGGDGRWSPGGGRRAGETARPSEEFGEEVELRRALELLAELIELEPQKLSLYRRRAEYARRLGDDEELVAAYLSWAEMLERRGSWRSAHLLCQQALTLRPDDSRPREALDRLEAEQGAELGVSLPKGPSWGRAWRERAEGASGLASTIWPELRRALEEVNWLQAAALRMLPGREDGPTDRAAAEGEAAEILGRYFVTRGDYERATEVLAPVVDRDEGADGDRLDALYLKGLAHLRMDEGERAERYFRRVARQDEEFRSVAGWFTPELEGVAG